MDQDDRYILAVVSKRTYRIGPNGACVRAEDELPLTLGLVADAERPDLLAADTDLYPLKLATDVVLKGHAYALSPSPVFEASVQIGRSVKSILVLGDRDCVLSSTGQVVFSEPRRLERVALTYTRAYGGRDAIAEAKYGNPFEALRPYVATHIDVARASPFIYPRNSCGTGYLVEAGREAVAQLRLPNLEDPQDRLSPERIAVGKPERWPTMPLPQGLDWVSPGWFPRLAYFGFVPPHEPLERPVAEVARGYAADDIMKLAPQHEKFSFRFTNGASLGLQLPPLKGDEECLLASLHPKQRLFKFRLPGERPKIWTDGRNGKLNQTDPVIHTVLIEPDESRVSIVWRGSAPAIRPYLAEELEKMPFRVEW